MTAAVNYNDIQVIFFDYGGTLDADGIAWKERFYPLYLKHDINVSREIFSSAFYRADDSLIGDDIVSFSLKNIVYEQVRRVLMNLKIHAPQLNRKIAEDFYQISVEKIEQNKNILRKIKKKYRLGIISNNYGNLQSICDETGLTPFMDILVDSTCIGFTKPDRRIFKYALEALKVKPEQTVMVGDSLTRDMGGAKAMGMRQVFLMSQHNQKSLNNCFPQYTVIRNLSQLLDIL